MRHPLAVLASRIPWQEIEVSVAHLFARRVRSGKTLVDVDLFGSTASLGDAGVAKTGRPVGLGPLADRNRPRAGTGAPSKRTSPSKVAGPQVLHLPARRLSGRLCIPLHDTHLRKSLIFKG